MVRSLPHLLTTNLLHHAKLRQMFFDLGVYGVPEKVRKQQPWNAKQAIRAMEKYTRDVGGYQVRL